MSGGVPALSDLYPRRRRYNYRRPSDPLTASSPHGSRRHLDSQKRVISELCFGRRHFAAREKAVMINLTTFLSIDAKIVADTRKDQGPFFFFHRMRGTTGTLVPLVKSRVCVTLEYSTRPFCLLFPF